MVINFLLGAGGLCHLLSDRSTLALLFETYILVHDALCTLKILRIEWIATESLQGVGHELAHELKVERVVKNRLPVVAPLNHMVEVTG